MISIGDRLKLVREALGYDQAKLATLLGIASRDTIRRWERGSTFPPADALSLLRENFGVNVDWLVSGQGPMWVRELEDGAPPEAGGVEAALSLDEYVMVPAVEGRVAAGPGGDILYDQADDWYPFKRWWIQRLVGKGADHQKALVLVRVQGDSMMPTINSGELILVDTWEAERLEVRNGRIYLVRLPDGGISVKRLMVTAQGGRPRIVCLSDNPAFEPFEFDVEEDRPVTWYVLGRVRWLGREMK